MAEAIAKTKGLVWKYFGAMMMETKGGQQAVSFTRFLGVILFFACLMIWCVATFMTQEYGKPAIDVPQGMLYTLWGLIGIKGAKDVASSLKGS